MTTKDAQLIHDVQLAAMALYKATILRTLADAGRQAHVGEAQRAVYLAVEDLVEALDCEAVLEEREFPA